MLVGHGFCRILELKRIPIKCVMRRKHEQTSTTGVLSYQPKYMTRRDSFGDRHKNHSIFGPDGSQDSAHPFHLCRAQSNAAGVEAFLATQFSSTATGVFFEVRELWKGDVDDVICTLHMQ